MTAIDTVKRLYTAFAAGDHAALGALLGDTQWVEAAGGPYGGTYQGFAQVAQNVFGPIGADVTEFTAIPDEFLAIGEDRVLAHGHYRGKTQHGPMAIRFAHLATVTGESISHFEQFTDTAQWRKAVG